jgi:hypothetical protein
MEIDLEQAGRVLPLVRSFVTRAKRPPHSADLLGFLRQIGHTPAAAVLQ